MGVPLEKARLDRCQAHQAARCSIAIPNRYNEALQTRPTPSSEMGPILMDRFLFRSAPRGSTGLDPTETANFSPEQGGVKNGSASSLYGSHPPGGEGAKIDP